MAIYTGTPAGREAWERLEAAERKHRESEGMKAWGEWMSANRERIVDTGGPLGKTKSISGAGIADIRNSVAAYVIVQAESHEAAARLFEAHPHFTFFPGQSVEVMECLPVPTQH